MIRIQDFHGTLITMSLLLATGLGANSVFAQTFTFSTCGALGASGPSQMQCDLSYMGTPLEGTVMVNAGIQSWTVPASGSYRITTTGAQGASADTTFSGGLGAQMQGEFILTEGTTLQFAVGQTGSINNAETMGGGGGGSFVVDSADAPLLAAGGGGGTRNDVLQNGCDASTTTFGIIGSENSKTSACTVKTTGEGQGGIVSKIQWGSAGAGFNSDGETDSGASPSGQGGRSWANGMLGGAGSAPGGFGGGGSGNGASGGGGGSGYSGGDGGRVAGGGGSFAAASAANPQATAAVGTGDGMIMVEQIATIAPTAVDDAATTSEATSVDIDVLANDTDPNEDDTLTIDTFDATSVEGGLITDKGNGILNYNPNGQFDYLEQDESATDTFTYTISDGQGGTDTATVTVTINGLGDRQSTAEFIVNRLLLELETAMEALCATEGALRTLSFHDQFCMDAVP